MPERNDALALPVDADRATPHGDERVSFAAGEETMVFSASGHVRDGAQRCAPGHIATLRRWGVGRAAQARSDTPQPLGDSMQLLETLSGQAEFINSQVIPWVLRLVMVGLGLSLTLADFKRVIVFPKAATIGLIAQLVGLPLAAFGLSLAVGAPPAIAIGLVILAACPSGVTSNAYSFAARADVPLCVTLSAVTSVVTVFTIPFLIDLALTTFTDQGQMPQMSIINMFRNLMTFTLLPLAIGMVFRAFFPDQANRAVEPIRKSVLYLMMFVLLLGVISSHRTIIDYFATAGALVVIMNLLTMGLGFGLAKLFKLPMTQVVTITFEVGVQNLSLALAIAYTILQRADLAVAALIYAAVMPATALAFVSIARRLLGGAQQAAAS